MQSKFSCLINSSTKDRRKLLNDYFFKCQLRQSFVKPSTYPSDKIGQLTQTYMYISLFEICTLISIVSQTVLHAHSQKQDLVRKIIHALNKYKSNKHSFSQWNTTIDLSTKNKDIRRILKQTPCIGRCLELAVYELQDINIAEYLPPFECLLCLSLVMEQDGIHDLIDGILMAS